jgi:hypothetical protein
MKKFFLGILAIGFLLQGCKNNDCDPGLPPIDDIIYINMVNPNGTGYLKYTGSVLPDSVKVLNLATNTFVTRSLYNDSILVINGWNATNNSTTSFKIMKGTIIKPDTLQVTVNRKMEQDKCGTEYDVARFGLLKVNTTNLCSGNCIYNTIYKFQK